MTNCEPRQEIGAFIYSDAPVQGDSSDALFLSPGLTITGGAGTPKRKRPLSDTELSRTQHVAKPTVPLLQCAWCGIRFRRRSKHGPTPKYCSRSHRQRAYEVRVLERWQRGS